MKVLKILYYLLFCILFSSCAFSREAVNNENLLQTSVVLTQRNYKVVGYANGISEQTYVLGIGGLSAKSLKESAMSEMLNKADLYGKPRAIVNVNVQFKNQYYILWSKKKAIATGTIIEFTK